MISEVKFKLLTSYCFHVFIVHTVSVTFFVLTRQKFLAENCSEINIQLDGHPISRVEHTKSLGLNIDDRPSWSNHIKDPCRKISSAIGALRRIRPLISQSTAVQLYNALIQPHFDYCAPFGMD